MNLFPLKLKQFHSLSKTILYKPTIMQQKVHATKAHCMYCFDVLLAKLNKNPIPPYPTNLLDTEVPIFVTWKKKQQLRGCIGTFTAGKLSKILPEYAVISSMKDPRFLPVSQDQVKQLSVGVSLLINFKENQSLYGWQIGKHGIIIKALHQGVEYSGTFLPEVAKQENWDHKQTLKNLIRKAGFKGKLQRIEENIKLITYQSSKQEIEYQQYCNLWNKERKK